MTVSSFLSILESGQFDDNWNKRGKRLRLLWWRKPTSHLTTMRKASHVFSNVEMIFLVSIADKQTGKALFGVCPPFTTLSTEAQTLATLLYVEFHLGGARNVSAKVLPYYKLNHWIITNSGTQFEQINFNLTSREYVDMLED